MRAAFPGSLPSPGQSRWRGRRARRLPPGRDDGVAEPAVPAAARGAGLPAAGPRHRAAGKCEPPALPGLAPGLGRTGGTRGMRSGSANPNHRGSASVCPFIRELLKKKKLKKQQRKSSCGRNVLSASAESKADFVGIFSHSC